jgi:hypothetical protein
MLAAAAMVIPMPMPKRLANWIAPQSFTLEPPRVARTAAM